MQNPPFICPNSIPISDLKFLAIKIHLNRRFRVDFTPSLLVNGTDGKSPGSLSSDNTLTLLLTSDFRLLLVVVEVEGDFLRAGLVCSCGAVGEDLEDVHI